MASAPGTFWLRLALTLACLTAILWQFGGTEAWKDIHVSAAGPFWLGILLIFPLVFLRTLKWWVLIRTAAPQAKMRDAFRSYLGALPLSLITPGKAGELIRGFYLPYTETRGWRAAGLTLIDNWSDFAGVALWTLPALALIGEGRYLTLGIIVTLLLGAIPLWLQGIRKFQWGQSRWATIWERFWPTSQTVGWKISFSILILAIVAYGLEWLQMSCFLAALHGKIGNISEFVGNMALIQMANSVQITVAGIGIREGSTAWMLQRAGWDAHLVLAAAFMQTTATLLLPALLGLLIRPHFELPQWKTKNRWKEEKP